MRQYWPIVRKGSKFRRPSATGPERVLQRISCGACIALVFAACGCSGHAKPTATIYLVHGGKTALGWRGRLVAVRRAVSRPTPAAVTRALLRQPAAFRH